jgi:UDP-N-acetylglucosamine diphosphorylase/glucosamine-1-phosphate N-acetyltransferase
MTPAIVFDDGGGRLAPLTDLRASFDIRTGALTTLERLRLALDLDVLALRTPEALAQLTRERHPGLTVNSWPGKAGAGGVLLINGRCPISYEPIANLEVGQSVVEESSGETIAAMVSADDAKAFMQSGTVPPTPAPIAKIPGVAMLSRPWHVRTFRDDSIASDLELLGDAEPPEIPPGVTVFGEHGLTIDPSAKVYPGVIIDLEHGPVAIGQDVTIRPGVTLIGPCAFLPHCTVLDKALIKGNTAIGPHCKVAGEVGGTIFQGYSNKGHDGHLGDSFVGEWTNLGAGTTNSNLLNTYAEVISVAAPGMSNERTGQQFLGAIIGDHVKTAICTRIMTGAVLHSGSMFAQSAAVSGCVAGFQWSTDAGRKPFRFDKFLEVAKAAMKRRKLEPTAAMVERLRDLHRSAVGSLSGG